MDNSVKISELAEIIPYEFLVKINNSIHREIIEERKIKRQSFNHRNKKSFSGSFRAPKENKFKIFIIIALSGIAIILLLLFYFIFISGFFNIRDIKIENANGKTEKLRAIVEEQIDGGGGLFSQKI